MYRMCRRCAEGVASAISLSDTLILKTSPIRNRGCAGPQNPPLWDFAQSRDSEKLAYPCAVSAVVAADWLRLDGGMET